MRHFLLFQVLVFTLCFVKPAFSQNKDKEAVKTIMTNQWVSKYKKLKTDLENKAIFIKNMENISERDLAKLKKSYTATSKMLDTWLDHLVVSIHDKNETMEQIAQGDINSELKEELQKIFTFYADNFSTFYEETTGQKSNFVIDSPKTEDSESNEETAWTQEKPIEVDFLLSNVKKPLRPNNWNSIF